jgi:GrpB-like predicted nucleotidyltransferase (UPF0157 family)
MLASEAQASRALLGRSRRYSPPVAAELVVVVPYDPEWPRHFETERALLEPVLVPWLKDGIHHIGATSIPGLVAKPIIDMMAGVYDLEEAWAVVEPLREESYVYTPHRPSLAHHFSKPSPRLSEMTHSLHLTEPGSDLWRERLAFRDVLRADSALAAEYEALKLRLAQEHREDVAAYTDGKHAFVARVLASAGIHLERLRPS